MRWNDVRGAMRSAILSLIALLAILPACSDEPEPVANRFERQKAEIENKARELETQVENEVSAFEAKLEDEADILLNRSSGNEALAGEAAPANTSR